MYIVLFKGKNIVLFQLLIVHSMPDYDITLKEHEIHKMSPRVVQSLPSKTTVTEEKHLSKTTI